jgi:peptidoglycan/LPS O-acetylase OafA/YrhL
VTESLLQPGAGELSEPTSAAVYRPQLDGMRALAVYLVVLFHSGSKTFSGGYIGVDVFFVLSGYLVTQLLLRDIHGRGSIRFDRFYARRFRRLLPAAFVALVVSAIVFAAIASPVEVADAVGSFKAAFLYSTNWYFVHQATGYFGANLATNPVLQFWSLAVEEQFYLVWPLALGGAFVLTRRLGQSRQIRVIRIVVAVGALASAAWALSLRTSDPNHAYYGTDARAYELLAGAFIALVPAFLVSLRRFHRSTRVAAAISLAALVISALDWAHLDAIERGVVATIATCALIVALETADGGFVMKALSNPTVVYLGKISYGTYLWHWIVILVLARTFRLSTIATVAIACLIATALASLSFAMVEQPVRLSRLLDGHRRAVIALGLAVSVVAALVVIPTIVDPARAAPPVAQGVTTAGFTPVPAGLDWQDAKNTATPFTNCLGKPASACTVVRGAGKHMLLMGDSHAWMLIPMFTEIARRENLTLSVSVRGGCPWQQNLYVTPITLNGTTLRREDCQAQKDDTYNRVIPALRPDVIIVMEASHQGAATPFLGPDGQALVNGSVASLRWVQTTTARSVAVLRAGGRHVVIVEPIPFAGFDTLACLSKAKVLEECRYVATTDPIERFYRNLAARNDNVRSADIDRLVCPFLPICDPVINGLIVKQDGNHLTAKFAASIAPQVDKYLQDTGVLPRRN